LNKLFYADFGHYKYYGQTISGIYYKALPKGPVPGNYGSLYNYLANKDFFKVEEVSFNDFVGDRYKTNDVVVFDSEKGPFTDTEISIMKRVS